LEEKETRVAIRTAGIANQLRTGFRRIALERNDRMSDFEAMGPDGIAEIAANLEKGILPDGADEKLFALKSEKRLLAWYAAKGGCLDAKFVNTKLLGRKYEGERYIANILVEKRNLDEKSRKHLLKDEEMAVRMAFFGCLPEFVRADGTFLDRRVENRMILESETENRRYAVHRGTTMRMLVARSGTLPPKLLEGRLDECDDTGRSTAYYAALGGLLPMLGDDVVERWLKVGADDGETVAHALASSKCPPKRFFRADILRLRTKTGVTVAHACASNLFSPHSLSSKSILSLSAPQNGTVAHRLLECLLRVNGSPEALSQKLLESLRSEELLNLIDDAPRARFDGPLSVAAMLSRLGLLRSEDVGKIGEETALKEKPEELEEMMRLGLFNAAHLRRDVLSRTNGKGIALEHAATEYGLLDMEYFFSGKALSAKSVLDFLASERGEEREAEERLVNMLEDRDGRMLREIAAAGVYEPRRAHGAGGGGRILRESLMIPPSQWSFSNRCLVANALLFDLFDCALDDASLASLAEGLLEGPYPLLSFSARKYLELKDITIECTKGSR